MEAAADASPEVNTEEVLAELAKEAHDAVDRLENIQKKSGPEMRSAWLEYGTVLLRIRSTIPSKPEFGQFIAANGLDKIGGEDTEKGVRNAAMKFAEMSEDERRVIAAMYPAVFNPRTIVAKFKGLLEEAYAELNDLCVAGDLVKENLTTLARGEEREVEATSNVHEAASALRRSDLYGLADFVEATRPVNFIEGFRKYKPKEKAERKSFVDLTVDEALDHIREMVKKHPEAEEIFMRLGDLADADDEVGEDDDD
jgi:hypothetical protein